MWSFFSRPARKAQVGRARRHCFRPRVEGLEDRYCLSPGKLLWSDPPPTHLKGLAYQAGLLQPDGDIVALGTYTTKSGQTVFGLTRYTSSGSLDTTFGTNGDVTTAFGKTNAGVWSAALYANAGTVNDGKIVAAGTGGSGLALARYNPNGSLDTTFGSGGTLTMASGIIPFSAAIQSDGKIVLGCYVHVSNPNTNNNAFTLLRFNTDGTLDSSFGQGGQVITNPTPYDNEINSIVILPSGDIMAGGYVTNVVVQGGVNWSFSEPTLARYTAGGALDSTFGSGGLVITPWVTSTMTSSTGYPAGIPESSQIQALALQGDGKLVAAGVTSLLNDPQSGYKWGLARYNADGSLDTTFGSGGTVVTQLGTVPVDTGHAWAVALQSNGEIVAAGRIRAVDANGVVSDNWAVATYSAAGALDPLFGGTGVVTTNLSGRPASVFIEPANGNIVVVGSPGIVSYVGTTTGPEIGSFTATPNPVTAGNNVTLTASNITDPDPGTTITQVAFYVVVSGTETLLGYGTQSSPGVWTLNFTVNLAAGTYTLYTQAEDNFGVFSNPFALTLTVQ